MAITLADVVRAGRPAFEAQYAGRLSHEHRRALQAITACRTGQLGHTLMMCTGCGRTHRQLRSCRHRSCPQCQHHSASQWLERQQSKLLPVDYFMVTFTLPAELTGVARRHPRSVYGALFSAATATLQQFAANHRLQVRLGLCAVLHTHSRRLDYHPHVHVIVPGGGINAQGNQWREFGRYLFNARNLAAVFRAKLIDALQPLPLPPAVPDRWIVDCRRVGSGLPALKYLSRYLYRCVIAERQLVALDAQRATVTFRYREGKSGRARTRTLSISEFLWRLISHVLPTGFQRARQFGFLHGNARRLLIRVQWLLGARLPPTTAPKARTFTCYVCQAPLRFLGFVPALGVT